MWHNAHLYSNRKLHGEWIVATASVTLLIDCKCCFGYGSQFAHHATDWFVASATAVVTAHGSRAEAASALALIELAEALLAAEPAPWEALVEGLCSRKREHV